MDALILSSIASRKLASTERFEQQKSGVVATTATNTSTAAKVFQVIVTVLIGTAAAALSWRCNTATGTSVIVKVIFAFFAFIFGLLYLILFFIFRWSDCSYITNLSAAPSASVPGSSVVPAPKGGSRRRS